MESTRPQKLAYAVDLQRRAVEGWHSQTITPSWFYGYQAADAAVQAFDRYLAVHGQSMVSLVAPAAHDLRILIRVQGAGGRPAVFTLQSVMEHKVRRDAGRRREALARLEDANEALRSSLCEASMAGVRQAHLARISGWSRETLRKLTRTVE